MIKIIWSPFYPSFKTGWRSWKLSCAHWKCPDSGVFLKDVVDLEMRTRGTSCGDSPSLVGLVRSRRRVVTSCWTPSWILRVRMWWSPRQHLHNPLCWSVQKIWPASILNFCQSLHSMIPLTSTPLSPVSTSVWTISATIWSRQVTRCCHGVTTCCHVRNPCYHVTSTCCREVSPCCPRGARNCFHMMITPGTLSHGMTVLVAMI